MKTQTIVNIVFAVLIIALAVIVFTSRNATFNKITCKEWTVVDKDGKIRIHAGTISNMDEGRPDVVNVTWRDKQGKARINVGTADDGQMIFPNPDINSFVK